MKFYDSSWNPFTGCTRCSEGCDRCVALENLKRQGRPTSPSLNPRALRRGPTDGTVMVCSQSDLFHEDFNNRHVERVLDEIAKRPNTRFLVTTRRERRMRKILSGRSLPNLWVGVSVENQERLSRVQALTQTSGDFHRWLCLEPLLGEIDLSGALTGVEWVEIGAERGEGGRPCETKWVKGVLDVCVQCGVPVFVNSVTVSGGLTDNWEEIPEEIRVRQWPWETDGDSTVIMAETPGLSGRVVKREDGSFLIDAPSFVYNHFAQDQMSQWCDIWFLSCEGGRTRFELSPKTTARPAVPETDYISNYTYFIWKHKENK